MLTKHGFRAAVMKADAVAPERREAWVADRVKEGLDVIDFPTIVWFETDYSVYTMRQASRRSWRIGQRRPVKVVFMAYRNSLQADALKLVAKKLQSSLAVEGELPEDGVAAFGDDGDDLMLALARKIVGGDEDDSRDGGGGVRGGAGGRHGWKFVEVEPEAVAINGNGHHANGNGRHANGNGRYDEAPEPQQSLFSWTEFMAEEPVKPRGRSRNPQPATASLFAWALEMEQEREEEPVGVGR